MARAIKVDDPARERMLSAAVEIIIEEGYYRASSNHIAKRAGVSWGAIQHHFGSREQLLLQVVHAGTLSLISSLKSARITGEGIEERLESLADAVWRCYRRPDFLASMEILLNLTKEPRTSADTIEELAATERQVSELWHGLVDQAVPAEHRRPELGGVVFQLIRGLAIGSNLLDAIPQANKTSDDRQARDVLVKSLSLYIGGI
ncbi:TetR/AcrR family transcriptional regulator [Streptomyces sp. NPDC091292]|uniref:TetR/AcrR family transcriptional regulator n=1 Tax=Streptomyces sp. NPDC091292 TaxID=3365991 RepID=UPI003801451A